MSVFITPESVTNEVVALDDLVLNRQARKLLYKELHQYPSAHFGFLWNDDDNRSPHWHPQGIAGVSTNNKKFIAVSWCNLDENQGARISFVDVTEASHLRYRHVLLIDKEGKPFKGMHAGGLAFHKEKLHVPDTREDGNTVRVFSTNSIKYVPDRERPQYFNYRYILQEESSYKLPVRPSFISYDWSRGLFLAGTFAEQQEKNIIWYKYKHDELMITQEVGPLYSKMQGAAAENDILWVSTSYGHDKDSALLYGIYKHEPEEFMTKHYPPGLEDLYSCAQSDNLWMLTEFGPREGEGNNRVVFSVLKQELMPH